MLGATGDCFCQRTPTTSSCCTVAAAAAAAATAAAAAAAVVAATMVMAVAAVASTSHNSPCATHNTAVKIGRADFGCLRICRSHLPGAIGSNEPPSAATLIAFHSLAHSSITHQLSFGTHIASSVPCELPYALAVLFGVTGSREDTDAPSCPRDRLRALPSICLYFLTLHLSMGS
jgi:hypothetical protein